MDDVTHGEPHGAENKQAIKHRGYMLRWEVGTSSKINRKAGGASKLRKGDELPCLKDVVGIIFAKSRARVYVYISLAVGGNRQYEWEKYYLCDTSWYTQRSSPFRLPMLPRIAVNQSQTPHNDGHQCFRSESEGCHLFRSASAFLASALLQAASPWNAERLNEARPLHAPLEEKPCG